MFTTRASIRIGAAASALALGFTLAACAAPSVPVTQVGPGPVSSSCPTGFVDQANAAAGENGLGITFSQADLADFEPEALQSMLATACILAFDGEIKGGHAGGTFAFVTTTLDGLAFETALTELGYEGSSGSWFKSATRTETEADVITQTTPNGSGSLLDLSDVFPEVTTVISSFHVIEA